MRTCGMVYLGYGNTTHSFPEGFRVIGLSGGSTMKLHFDFPLGAHGHQYKEVRVSVQADYATIEDCFIPVGVVEQHGMPYIIHIEKQEN